MKRKGSFLAMMIFGALCCGCLSKQVARDGIDLRQAILDIYTDQIMDNLIRAKNNMPFVQLKYSQIQVNDLHDLSSTGTFDQAVSTVRNLVVAGAMKTVAVDAKGSVSGDCKRTMSFNADPITDSNDVYDKYIKFAQDEGKFMATAKPPRCAVHIMKKCGHLYYWVPRDAGDDFLKLCMETTFKRGKNDDAPPIPGFRAVKIVDVIDARKSKDPERTFINASLKFDKKVPNDTATLVVDLPDRKITMSLHPFPGLAIADNTTDTLIVQWDSEELKLPFEKAMDLKGRSARLYSYNFPAELQPPPPPLDQVNTTLNAIRVQLQNQSNKK